MGQAFTCTRDTFVTCKNLAKTDSDNGGLNPLGIVGEVQARNADNGELVWTRPVIEGHMGTLNGKPSTLTGVMNATWLGDMWKTGGGANWLGGSYDAATDTIIFGAGNPAPWNSYLRKGDNLYAASRIGLDPATGEIKWHYQTTPREGWDYDGVNEVVPFIDRNGEDGLATADRNGFFYILDRRTGSFKRGTPFVKSITWAAGIDNNGRPKFVEANRPGNPADSIDGKKGKTVFAVPSFLGGKNWQPMSFSPKTKLFYVPSNEWGMDIWDEPINTGTPEGHLKAFDDETGEELWAFQTGSGVVGQPITWDMDGEQYVAVLSG